MREALRRRRSRANPRAPRAASQGPGRYRIGGDLGPPDRLGPAANVTAGRVDDARVGLEPGRDDLPHAHTPPPSPGTARGAHRPSRRPTRHRSRARCPRAGVQAEQGTPSSKRSPRTAARMTDLSGRSLSVLGGWRLPQPHILEGIITPTTPCSRVRITDPRLLDSHSQVQPSALHLRRQGTRGSEVAEGGLGLL